MKFADLLSTGAKAAINGMRKRVSIPLACVAGEIGLGVYVDPKNTVTHLTAFIAVDGQGALMKTARRDKTGEWEELPGKVPEGGKKIRFRIDITEDPSRALRNGERLTSLRVRFTPTGRVLYSLDTPEGAKFIPQSPSFEVDKSESVFQALSRLIMNINGVMTPDSSLVPYGEEPGTGHPNVHTPVLDERVALAIHARRGEEPMNSARDEVQPVAPAEEVAAIGDDF